MSTDVDEYAVVTYGLFQLHSFPTSKLIGDCSLRSFPEGLAYVCRALHLGIRYHARL